MNPKANPLDYVIRCAEQGLIPEKFDILNAKNELDKLREKIKNFADEIVSLQGDYKIAFWARINNRGDLYNPSIVFNPYLNQDTVLPVYVNKEEYKAKYGNLSK